MSCRVFFSPFIRLGFHLSDLLGYFFLFDLVEIWTTVRPFANAAVEYRYQHTVNADPHYHIKPLAYNACVSLKAHYSVTTIN